MCCTVEGGGGRMKGQRYGGGRGGEGRARVALVDGGL